jgi:acyl carrier protein
MARIAPEIDINGIDPQADLRRTLDIDSFDLLKLLIGLHETLGVEIPETDYGKLRSLNALVSYLLSHA